MTLHCFIIGFRDTTSLSCFFFFFFVSSYQHARVKVEGKRFERSKQRARKETIIRGYNKSKETRTPSTNTGRRLAAREERISNVDKFLSLFTRVSK